MANSSTAAAAGATVDLSDVGDPTISMLWRRIYAHLSLTQVGQGMAVCTAFKQLLPQLVTRIVLPARWGSSSAAQQALQHIAATFTQLQELDISAECPDGQAKLDFGGVSLPCLTRLRLRCQPLRALNFTAANTPKLESLSLESCGEVASFRLELPELQQLFFKHVKVHNERGFGRSLASCPKLETVNCYKLWGLGGSLHELRLPQCREISFYRSDDLEGIKLWAPKLAELRLRACYSLDCVRIMDDPTGTPPTPLRVNLINASINSVSKRHLQQHPRVTAPGGKLITRECDDPRTMFFGEGDFASGEEDDDRGFGCGAGSGFIQTGMATWPGSEEDEGEWETDNGGAGSGFMEGLEDVAAGCLMGAGQEEPLGSGGEVDEEDEGEWQADSGDEWWPASHPGWRLLR